MKKKPALFPGAFAVAGEALLILTTIFVIGLMLSGLTRVNTVAALRVTVTLLAIAFALCASFLEGRARGAGDMAASAQARKLMEAGHTPERRLQNRRYRALRSVVGCAGVYALPLALAVIVALFGTTPDPQATELTALEWMRLFTRMLVLPYANLFADPYLSTRTLDLLTPLALLSYPAAYVAGYLRGPAQHRQREAAVLRSRRAAERRARDGGLAKTLTGDAHPPHYGHRPEGEKPRRKRLH